MRLTKRCTDLLNLLKVAGWLSTNQIHRRFFIDASLDAARKRLRILVNAGYLVAFQQNRMTESVFTLGKEAKRYLEKFGSQEICLARKPPKTFAHQAAVNDLRIAAEISEGVAFFFAYWELPSLNWNQPIIPDAVFSTGNQTYFAEYDRGFENVGYFAKTKIAAYRNGIGGFPAFKLLIIADSQSRLDSLARATGHQTFPVLYSTINEIRESGLSVLKGDLSSQTLFPAGEVFLSNSMQSL
jgi:hypothetical protein